MIFTNASLNNNHFNTFLLPLSNGTLKYPKTQTLKSKAYIVIICMPPVTETLYQSVLYINMYVTHDDNNIHANA